MIQVRRQLIVLILLAAIPTACARHAIVSPARSSAMPFPVDSARKQTIAEGVTREFIRSPKGPWVINALYVDLDRCNAPEAIAGGEHAIGRMKTTEMLAALARTQRVVGGVNADFFNLQTG